MPSIKNFKISSSEFSRRIMESQAVAIVPGNIFGSFSDDRLRISYATEYNKLSEALDRIEKFINSL